MNKYTTQSEATRILAAQQTHSDPHPGHGVLAMPSHAEIAKRAYDIYLKSGAKPGHCTQNWQKAEHDLRTADHRS